MASNFNVTGLSAYTKTNEETLIIKSFFEPKTASMMQVLTGVKSVIQVPSLSQNVIFQNGASCGFSASGNTTLSARDLTVGRVKINHEWCMADLETKYTQLLLSPGSNYTALPGKLDQAFAEIMVGQIAQDLETAIWSGDTASWNSQLNQFDGLIKIIGAASGTVAANAAAYMTPVTAVTAANVIAILDGIYTAIPAVLLGKPDLKVFIGNDMARMYQTALKNANLYNYPVSNESANGEFKIAGTDVTVVPVNGLTGSNKAYALRTSNMFLGVDLENEEEEFKFWFSSDFDMVRFSSKFKYGVQISLPTEIVKFTL